MLFRLSFCLGYVNHVCPTKKCKLWIHYTVHCTLYTVHSVPYRPELSTPETHQERGHMEGMLL